MVPLVVLLVVQMEKRAGGRFDGQKRKKPVVHLVVQKEKKAGGPLGGPFGGPFGGPKGMQSQWSTGK